MGCIYQAVNTVNGKSYIGKTVKTIGNRIGSHLRAAKSGSTFVFHKAIRKYGSLAFTWSVLLDESDERLLNRWERYYIKRLMTKVPNGYNLTDGGEGLSNPSDDVRVRIGKGMRGNKEAALKISVFATGRRHTSESKLKNRLAHLGKPAWNKGKRLSATHVKNLQKSHRGLKLSDEHKLKISLIHKGRVHTAQARKNMSTAQLGNQKRLGRHNTVDHNRAISEGHKRFWRFKDWESCSL